MARRRMVVWRGASRLDGVTPVVVLATYDSNPLRSASANGKTGGMVQTWILVDGAEPLDVLMSGGDAAICGTCPHRGPASGGSGACYVNVGQAPNSTYRAYRRDGSRVVGRRKDGSHPDDSVPFDVEVFRGRVVRFGSYGDPAAVPVEVWEAIRAVARDVTGYTHAWRSASPRFAAFAMASADTVEEGREARRAGYRSFIVRGVGDPKPRGAVTCPASAEAGHRTVCASCLKCSGTGSGRRGDVTIVAHGSSARKFRPLPLSVV